jgi:alpha-L-fucosidase
MISRFGDGRDWFFEKRVGLFVHWGLYAVLGWHEQDQIKRNIPRCEYSQLAQRFNPVGFDPDRWLDLADEAGMGYVCLTTKHIDGFCLWDTKQTDYNVMHTPYGRDIVGMLAEACHRRGFPLCLYYSIPDLHQPNYPHAGRSYEWNESPPGDEPDLAKYLDFMRAQVRELCICYGELGGFWWDANVLGVDDPSFNQMIRSLQPSAVINDRGPSRGDFSTPEREYPHEAHDARAFTRPTEACQSIGVESWGYKEDEDYYTLRYLRQSLDKNLARGGNYLLNVGPRAAGTFPPEAESGLRGIGTWYRSVREAFEQAEPAPDWTENTDVFVTTRGDTVYIHVSKDPIMNRVLLKPIGRLPRRATLLNTGDEVECRLDITPYSVGRPGTGKPYLRLRNLPISEYRDCVMVVKLEFG